jgi:amino-acid N-acetyltransferase
MQLFGPVTVELRADVDNLSPISVEMNRKTTLRCAQPADIRSVRALLESCDLPHTGIEDQFEDAFVVAERDGQIIGVAGLERYGEHGLLRSVAVSEPHRGQALARSLVDRCLTEAWRLGLSDVYLLTLDAQTYFEALGFKVISRAEVAHGVTKSREFSSICPETATVMVQYGPRLRRHPGANRSTGDCT